METWDLIVLGGGLAGLTAAASAAKAGRRVLVCERQSHLGGRAATDSTEGFSLHLGPHALYPGGAAFRALRALGIDLPGAPPRVVGYATSGGQLHTLPAGPVSLLLSGLLSPAGKWELGRILGSLDRIDPARFQGQSVDQVVASLAANPGARTLLRAFLRLSSHCEDTDAHCGAAALDSFLRSVRLGVFYVEGGWQTMTVRAADLQRAAGAGERAPHALPAGCSAVGGLLRGGRPGTDRGTLHGARPTEALRPGPLKDAMSLRMYLEYYLMGL
jgi:hypothetical protein